MRRHHRFMELQLLTVQVPPRIEELPGKQIRLHPGLLSPVLVSQLRIAWTLVSQLSIPQILVSQLHIGRTLVSQLRIGRVAPGLVAVVVLFVVVLIGQHVDDHAGSEKLCDVRFMVVVAPTEAECGLQDGLEDCQDETDVPEGFHG